MNKFIITLAVSITCLFAQFANAQNPISQNIQTEFGIGFATSILHSGKELIQSQELRNQGLSYFQNSQGIRKNVGSYGTPIGWVLTTAYYRPIKKVKGLMLGTALRASLTGSQPSSDGYEEGYFFNFITVTGGAKYYPFTKNNLFILGEFGLASVLTKNRFINEVGKQNYFQQFGIGINVSAAIGYSLKPIKNSEKSFDIKAVYQLNNTTVEVDNIGNDLWQFSGLNLIASINF
jgi:hypothetical protein